MSRRRTAGIATGAIGVCLLVFYLGVRLLFMGQLDAAVARANVHSIADIVANPSPPILIWLAWAYSFRAGMLLAVIGGALHAGMRKGEVRLIAAGGVVYLASCYVPFIEYKPAYFGILGTLILVAFLFLVWDWMLRRPTLSDDARIASDLRMVGHYFLVAATWSLCGIFGIVTYALQPEVMLARGLRPAAVMLTSHVMADLTIGWFFLAASSRRERASDGTSRRRDDRGSGTSAHGAPPSVAREPAERQVTRWKRHFVLAALIGIGCAKPLPLPEPYAGPEPRSDPSEWVDAIPPVVQVADAASREVFGGGHHGVAVEEATQLGLDTATKFKLGMRTGDVMDVAKKNGLVIGKAASASRCRGALAKPLCLQVRLPGRALPPLSMSRIFYEEWPGSAAYDLLLALDDDRVVSMSLQARSPNEHVSLACQVYIASYYGRPPDEAIRLGETINLQYRGMVAGWDVGVDGLFHWWWSRDRHAVLLEHTSRDDCVVSWGFPEVIARPRQPGGAGSIEVRPLEDAATAPARSRSGLLAFYAPARDRAASPPNEEKLTIVCQRQLRGASVPAPYVGLWISLMGFESGPVRIAAFTKTSFVDPPNVIWLRARYAPFPVGAPGRQGTLDWGWVYDRNGDGRIDYLVYLQDVLPVLPDPVPASFPTTEGSRGTIWRLGAASYDDARARSKPLLEAALEHAQMVFRHYADEDFDGNVDAIVLEELEPAGLFVKGWLAYRSSRAGGEVDEAWAFRGAIDERRRALDRDPAGYLVPAVGKKALEPVGSHLGAGTDRIRAVDAALVECRLGPRSLARAP